MNRRRDLIMLAAFATAMLAASYLIGDLYTLKLLTFVGINLIVAGGLSILFGYTGQISLGHAAFFGIGAYASAILTTRLHWNGWAAMAAALLITCAVAWLIAIPALKLKGHYLAMATLGFGEIMYTIFNQASGLTGGPNGISNIPYLSAGPLVFESIPGFYRLVWVMAALVLLVAFNIVRSGSGRSMLAIHGAETAAESSGIPAARTKTAAFVLSAACGSIAGSLMAHMVNYISPSSFTVEYSVLLVVIVFIGGLGSIWGTLAATFFMTLMPEYVREFKEYSTVIYALVLLFFVIFLPGGMSGMSRRVAGLLPRREAS